MSDSSLPGPAGLGTSAPGRRGQNRQSAPRMDLFKIPVNVQPDVAEFRADISSHARWLPPAMASVLIGCAVIADAGGEYAVTTYEAISAATHTPGIQMRYKCRPVSPRQAERYLSELRELNLLTWYSAKIHIDWWDDRYGQVQSRIYLRFDVADIVNLYELAEKLRHEKTVKVADKKARRRAYEQNRNESRKAERARYAVVEEAEEVTVNTAPPGTSHSKRHTHGLSLDEQHRLRYDIQGNRCAICKTDLDGLDSRQVHIDHDHAHCRGQRSCSDCARGIVCGPCNTRIMMFENDVENGLTADVTAAIQAYLATPPWSGSYSCPTQTGGSDGGTGGGTGGGRIVPTSSFVTPPTYSSSEPGCARDDAATLEEEENQDGDWSVDPEDKEWLAEKIGIPVSKIHPPLWKLLARRASELNDFGLVGDVIWVVSENCQRAGNPAAYLYRLLADDEVFQAKLVEAKEERARQEAEQEAAEAGGRGRAPGGAGCGRDRVVPGEVRRHRGRVPVQDEHDPLAEERQERRHCPAEVRGPTGEVRAGGPGRPRRAGADPARTCGASPRR